MHVNQKPSQPLSHPSPAEWMEYLYGESTRSARSALAAHLDQCPTCRERTLAWQATRQALDQWTVPAPQRWLAWVSPTWVRWGAAAVLLLGLGFLFGRFSTPPAADPVALRAEMRKELQAGLGNLRASLTRELGQAHQAELAEWSDATVASLQEQTRNLLTDFAQDYDQTWRQEYQTLANRLQRLAAERAADRKDLETLALTAQGELLSTRQQIGQLTAFNRPPDSGRPPR